MTVWRMETLRLTRTGRWIPLVAVFGVFGILGPVTTRYQQALFRRFGTGSLRIIVPPPVATDGIRAFLGNAQEFGLLAVVIIAAGALAFDARPEASAFLRTRVRSILDLVGPKVVANAAAAVTAATLGFTLAWGLTVALIGSLPTGRMIVGVLLWWEYLLFAVSVVAVAASIVRSQLSVVLAALAILVALGVMALVRGVGPWLPSFLVGAPVGLLTGRTSSEFVRAAVITPVVAVGLVWYASKRLERREL